MFFFLYRIEQPGSDLAWYVNGLLVPELYLRRELTYSFQVEGGNDPHSPTHYHPLIITDEPIGGYEQMTEEQRKNIRVLAGVEFTRRGQPRPTAGMFESIAYSYNAILIKMLDFHSWKTLLVASYCTARSAPRWR